METNHKKLVFKTNINCGGCISAVTPFLNNLNGVDHWDVDTNNKDKILTVQAMGITNQQVIETVEKAGFKIEPVDSK